MEQNEKGKTLAEQAAERDAVLRTAGRGVDGDWVYTHQGVASEHGFDHVSKDWWEQTTPVEKVVDALAASAEECLDLQVDRAAVRVADDLSIELDGERLEFADEALRSLATWGRVPTAMISTFHRDGARADEDSRALLAKALNWGLDKEANAGEFLLRLRGQTVRAVVSDSYAPIENAWVMETLAALVPGGRVSHFRTDGDSMSGLLLIPDTIRSEKDSDYGGGIHFKNSEVGRGRVITRPSVFRAICMNGCIWAELSAHALVQKVHKGTPDFGEIAMVIAASVQESIPLTSICLESMLATAGIQLGSRIETLRVIAKAGEFSPRARQAWVEGWLEEGGQDTGFALVQGLTRAGRDMIDPVAAVEAESFAGVLCGKDADGWDEMLARYRGLDEGDLVRILGAPAVASAL